MNFSKFKTDEILAIPVEAPIKETFEFVTDVIETFNGLEERHQMRKVPKQSFNYSVIVNADAYSKSFNQLQEYIRRDWAIPIWTEILEQRKLVEGQLEIEIPDYYLDYEIGNSLFIYRFCSSNWLAFDIVGKYGNKIKLNKPMPKDISSCYIMPLKRAWVRGNGRKSTNGNRAKLTLNFVMYDVFNIPADNPPIYNSKPFRNVKTLLNDGNTERDVVMRQDISDFNTGVVKWRTTWKRSHYNTDLDIKCVNKEELFKTKQLMFYQKGKYNSFRLPTYENIFKPSKIEENLIFGNNTGFADVELPFDLALHVGESYIPCTIIEAQVTDQNVTLVASRSISVKVPEIDSVSYLKLNRFDSDIFDFNYEAGFLTSLKTSLSETNS